MPLNSRVIGMTIYHWLKFPTIIVINRVLQRHPLRPFMGGDVDLLLGGLRYVSFL